MLKQLAPFIGPLLVIALLGWRMRKSMQGRALKPSRLWIRPAILALFLALTFLHPPVLTPLHLALFGLAAAVGIGLGYLMASHQHLTIDAASGAITSRTSAVGMILFLGVFAVRFAVNRLLLGGQAPDRLAAHSDKILFYSDLSLLFLLGLVAAEAWEIGRRAKALQAETPPKPVELLPN